MFFKMVEPTESCKSFTSLPYIKGITGPLTRVLKKRDVTFVNNHLPLTTSNNQRLANAGEDFFFAHLVNKRFGGL